MTCASAPVFAWSPEGVRQAVSHAVESGDGIKRIARFPHPALMERENSARWENEDRVYAFFSLKNACTVVPQTEQVPFMACLPFFIVTS